MTLTPLLIAAGIFGLVLVARAARIRHGLVYFLLGRGRPGWRCSSRGSIPSSLGLAMGLIDLRVPGGPR